MSSTTTVAVGAVGEASANVSRYVKGGGRVFITQSVGVTLLLDKADTLRSRTESMFLTSLPVILRGLFSPYFSLGLPLDARKVKD